MKHLIFFLLLCVNSSLVFSQYDSLRVGQTTGDSIHHVTDDWWLQVSVPSLDPFSSGVKSLDINGDGTNDLKISLDVWGTNADSVFLWLESENGSEILAQTGGQYTDSLVPNDLLLSSLNWVNTSSLSTGNLPLNEIRRGNMSGSTDIETGIQYFAVRFPVQGQWFYAWLRYYAYGYSIHWGSIAIEEYAWKGNLGLVDIEDRLTTEPIGIFPNPTSGTIHLSLPNDINGGNDLTVYDISGKPVYRAKLSESENQLDLNELAPGMYFLKIRNEDSRQFVGKFMRMN